MIRLMQKEDIYEILPYLRQQEIRTIDRLQIDPERLLLDALGPYSFAGLADGRVGCLWGLVFPPNVGGLPRLWLLTTPTIERHRVRFLRESRRFVRWAASEFGVLEGCVDCENLTSRRWLEWLDFVEVSSYGGYTRMIRWVSKP